MKNEIRIKLSNYCLKEFFYALNCSDIHDITITTEDSDLICRINVDQMREKIYPREMIDVVNVSEDIITPTQG